MENILAAHSWCDHAPGGAQIGFRLTRGIKTFAINCGQLTVGHRVIAEALARPGASARDELRCRALFDVGQLTFFMGRYPEAQRHLEESLAIARELDHKLRIAAALQPLGMAYQGQGMTTQARATLEEALALARDAGSKRDVGAALNNLGSFQRIVGELETAERLYEEAMVILRSVGDHFSCALIVLNFAILSILREDRQRARAFLLEAIATAEKLGQQRWAFPQSRCARDSPPPATSTRGPPASSAWPKRRTAARACIGIRRTRRSSRPSSSGRAQSWGRDIGPSRIRDASSPTSWRYRKPRAGLARASPGQGLVVDDGRVLGRAGRSVVLRDREAVVVFRGPANRRRCSGRASGTRFGAPWADRTPAATHHP